MDAKRCLREIAILRRLDHPNVIKVTEPKAHRNVRGPTLMFNCFQVLDILEPVDGSASASAAVGDGSANGLFKDLYVVLQDGGIDLHRYFQETSRKTHELREIKHISKQLCAAMSYLHSCRVVHRDLKPHNVLAPMCKYYCPPSTPLPSPIRSPAQVLIDPRTLSVRIADFGLCRSFELPPGSEIAEVLPSPRQIRKSQSELNFEAFAVNRDLFGNDDLQAEEGLLDGLSKYANGFYGG